MINDWKVLFSEIKKKINKIYDQIRSLIITYYKLYTNGQRFKSELITTAK